MEVGFVTKHPERRFNMGECWKNSETKFSEKFNDINNRLHSLEILLSSPNTTPYARNEALTTLRNLLDELDVMLEEATPDDG